MKFSKLTALSTLCIALLAGFSSCEKESEKTKVFFYTKSDIPMTGAQVVPATPSSGVGSLSVSYDKRSKVLNYSMTWTGLSDSVIAIRINGPAPTGYSSLNTAFTGANPTSYTTTPYLVIQQFTGGTSAPFKPMFPSAGTYSGSLTVDGNKFKEADLLNHQYYVTIHTKTILPVASPGNLLYRWFGEIRAQIVFQ